MLTQLESVLILMIQVAQIVTKFESNLECGI